MGQDFTFVNHDQDRQVGKTRLLKALVRSHAARIGQPTTRAPRKARHALRPKYIDLDNALTFEYAPAALQEVRESQKNGASSDSSSGTRSGSSTSDDVSPPSLVHTPDDPMLASLPMLNKHYGPFLQDYYIRNMAVDIPELDLSTPGLLRSVWFPFVLNSPALLAIIFLTAGSHFYNHAVGTEEELSQIRRNLLEIKLSAIKLVNSLMVNKTKSVSDEVVLAVGKMASCEAMFGSEETFHMHMAGLERLVHIRGGVDQLGFDGLLARMVCWIDFNAACLLGTTPYLAETAASLPRPLSFHPKAFVGAS